MPSGPGRQPPPVTGFLRTTLQQREQWLGWDLVFAAVLTAVGVIIVETKTLDAVLTPLLLAEFGLIGAVLGVVIAGLAIVVAFLSKEYTRVLNATDDGPIGDFWPFWFVGVLSASAVIAAGAGLVVAEQAPDLRRLVFGVTTFLATYSVCATANLVAFLTHQGVTRAWQLSSRMDPEDGARSRISDPSADLDGGARRGP